MKPYQLAKMEHVDAAANPKISQSPNKLVIGRREWIGLPALGLPPIHAKTDTGAYHSSLHALETELFEKEDAEWVRFVTIVGKGKSVACEAAVAFRKRVKSSNGESGERLFIRTKFRSAAGLEWPARVSLADRSAMRFPLLVGRRALGGRFVVDTSATYALGE